MPLHQKNRYTADEYFAMTPQTSERTELIDGGACGAIIKQAASKKAARFFYSSLQPARVKTTF